MLATLMGWLFSSSGSCGALSDQLADARSRIAVLMGERDELRKLVRRADEDQAALFVQKTVQTAAVTAERDLALRLAEARRAEIVKLNLESIRLTEKMFSFLRERHEVDQILGEALGFPKCYPDVSPEDDGSVYTGPHTVVTLAEEAAQRIADLVNGPTRVPDGFVVVPVQPTRDMLDAAWADVLAEDAAGAWKSMIGAARSLDDAASGGPAAEAGGPP